MLFKLEMHKTLQIPAFLKAKKQQLCKLQHFLRVDRKKCWYLHGFCNLKKTWKARTTVNSDVLVTFGRRNVGIYTVEPIFCFDEHKKRWYLRVFQKIEHRDVNETL